MASDLTERLAAKLGYKAIRFDSALAVYLRDVATWLPILLSEPELVAGLAPEVKREVLRVLIGERLNSGVLDALADLHTGVTGYDVCEAEREAVLNLLAPSPAPMEGRSNDG